MQTQPKTMQLIQPVGNPFLSCTFWPLAATFPPPLTLHIFPCLIKLASVKQMADMVQKLCSMSKGRVILSFAPNTWYYSLLKKVGGSRILQ